MGHAQTDLAAAQLAAGHLAEAVARFTHLLKEAPQDFDLNLGLGTALCRMGRGPEAIACLDRCAAQRGDVADVFYWRGKARAAGGDLAGALPDFGTALALQPDHVQALTDLGGTLQLLNRHREVLDVLARLDRLVPGHRHVLGHRLYAAQALCDWQTIAALRSRVEAQVKSGEAIISPQTLLMSFDDPALLQVGARHFQRDLLAGFPAAEALPVSARTGKIRIAYVSADFRSHATAYLISDLIQRHDRTRFEVIGVSTGPDDGSSMRAWLKKSFDRFLDTRGLHDTQVVEKLRALDVDIAVDFNGHTRGGRIGIMALRAAPVQVNFLGFPGTMGAEFMDYIIADPVLAPRADWSFYDEKLALLPGSYQPNSPMRPRQAPFPRKACKLPEDDFVFCSFNGHTKITEEVFAVWIRLLAATPGSVLWLLHDTADDVLRGQAQAHGIDPRRLVFAERAPVHLHLARLALADLALDTMPCNGHTTTSDALWMELPVVACMGRSFAGRVSASLLRAVGLPELVQDTLADYEAFAKALAADRPRLAALRARLAANRETAPLFDAARYCADIERAFIVMAERARDGAAVQGFEIQV